MMKNLTKGEMVFRVVMGVALIVAFYVPLTAQKAIIWIVAGILIISGILKYCPVCQIVDGEK